jgi:hypothetical protein
MQMALRTASLSLALVASQAYAAGTHFGFKQIIIAGSSNVQATALNNKSVIIGDYTDANGASHGFIQNGSSLTMLPQPYSNCNEPSVAHPVALNAAGDVVGTSYCSDANYGFLWHNDAYVKAGAVTMGLGGLPAIGINNKGEEFYNDYVGSGIYTAWAGMPGAFMQIKPPGSFPFISSLNNQGVVAGSFDPDPPEVFTESNGVYAPILPPGALDSTGGFVNNNGLLAGLFQTQRGDYSGFVFNAGRYFTFVIPSAPTQATIDAINNSGRVVGVYTDAVRNMQRAFLFNGTAVSVFGTFPSGDAVHVALNDEGTMLVYDYSVTQNTTTSWRVLCGGPGC